MAHSLGEEIEEANTKAVKRVLSAEAGRFLSLVASVVGTDKDPQNLQKQLVELKKAGVVIMPSNAQAAKVAALIALRGSIRRV